MSQIIVASKRTGHRGRTKLEVDKKARTTLIKVVNTDAYGQKRQISFALDVNKRRLLLEALLEHHEQDVG